jgi:hypothetical protein
VREGKDFRGAGGDVNVLPIVTAEQGYNLSLKTPTAPFGVSRDAISEGGREPDSTCDRGVMGEG